MLPRFEVPNIIYGFVMNVETFRNGDISNTFIKKSLYFFNFLRTQFSMEMPISKGMSKFFNAIVYIFKMCPYAEMTRIYACWNIARVHNFFTFWDRPLVEFIRKTVCKFWYSTRMAKYAIPKTASSPSRPQPAGFCFFNFFPESFLDWDSFVPPAVIIFHRSIIHKSYYMCSGYGATCR